MRKRKGSLIDVFPCVLVILSLTVITFVSMNVAELLSFRQEVKALARGYILEMETSGYLTSANVSSFTQELTNMGVTDIDLSGTTITSVGYGQPIFIKLNCNVSVDTLNMTGGKLIQFFFEEAKFPIPIKLRSTAKH